MKYIVFIVTTLFSINSLAASYIDGNVQEISSKYGAACIAIKKSDNTIETVKLDIATDIGKAEFAVALTAYSSGKKLTIYQLDTIYSGVVCNLPNVKQHGMVILQAQ